jgi:hypothetical protein
MVRFGASSAAAQFLAVDLVVLRYRPSMAGAER